MKFNNIRWAVVSVFAVVTITILFISTKQGSGQHEPEKQKEVPYANRSKYPVALYDEPEPADMKEWEIRKRKSKRYDDKSFVAPNLTPDVGDLIIRFDGEDVPPALPTSDSNLIIIGEIKGARASMSNDKSGVYSEYSVRIVRILKNDGTREWRIGQIVTADRTGGIVQYSNGHRVLYMNNWADLPELNEKYFLFLSKDGDKDPNYKLVTGYQLKNGNTIPLDNGPRFSKLKGISESDFVRLIGN